MAKWNFKMYKTMITQDSKVPVLTMEQKEFIKTNFDTKQYAPAYAGSMEYGGMMFYIDLSEELFECYDYYAEFQQAPILDYLADLVWQMDGMRLSYAYIDGYRLWFELYDKYGKEITEHDKYIRERLKKTAFLSGKGTKLHGCWREYEDELWNLIKSMHRECNLSLSYRDMEEILPYEEWEEEFYKGYNYVKEYDDDDDDDDLPF